MTTNSVSSPVRIDVNGTPAADDAQLERDLHAYAWEQTWQTLKPAGKRKIAAAVDAWIEGQLSVESAAAAVRVCCLRSRSHRCWTQSERASSRGACSCCDPTDAGTTERASSEHLRRSGRP